MNLQKMGVLIIFVLLTGCAGNKPTLGVETGKLIPCPTSPNCVNSQVSGNEHFIEPIIVNKTQLQSKEQLIKILHDTKNAEIKAVKNDYIRVEFVSVVFRFVDDVEFYFPATSSTQTIIHVRSASRVGRSDFGVNRKRIEAIRNQLSFSNR